MRIVRYTHPSISRSAPFPAPRLPNAPILIPFMPFVNFASYTLSVTFVLRARFYQKLRTVPRATEVTLEVFPTAVGLKSTVCMRTPVWAQSLWGKKEVSLNLLQNIPEWWERRMSKDTHLMCPFVFAQITRICACELAKPALVWFLALM